MNAERVHGGGELLASISERCGRLGQYGSVEVKADERGMATLNGRVATKSFISSSDFSSSVSESTFVLLESRVSVGDAMKGEVVWSFSNGRPGLRMLMLFQIPLGGRRAWRSFCRSSPCRGASCGCERRVRKASLALRGRQRNGMVKEQKRGWL